MRQPEEAVRCENILAACHRRTQRSTLASRRSLFKLSRCALSNAGDAHSCSGNFLLPSFFRLFVFFHGTRFDTWRTHRGLNRRKVQRTDCSLLTYTSSLVVSSLEKKKGKTQKKNCEKTGSNINENFFTKSYCFFQSPTFFPLGDSTVGELIGV